MGTSHASRRSAALLLLLAAACTGGDGQDGADGKDAVSPSVVVADEPAGPSCPAGGKRITVQEGPAAPTVTYVCNGQAGLVAWDAVSSATVARPAHGYLAVGASQVTLTLPASAGLALGDEVDAVGVGTGGFAVVPAPGQRILFGDAVTPLPGHVWVPRETPRYWKAVASSADGTKLVAAVGSGQLYTSSDSGATWTARDSNRNWVHLASSADGTKLVAAVYQGQLYTSSDSGATWTPRDASRGWTAVASSSDGTRLVAAASAAAGSGRLYASDDAGTTWTERGDARESWSALASSADGTKLAGIGCRAALVCDLYTSSDAGATWTVRDATPVMAGTSLDWSSVASSADGARLLASAQNDALFTSAAPSGSTALLEGGFGDRVQLTYAGGDTWIVSGTLGTISAF